MLAPTVVANARRFSKNASNLMSLGVFLAACVFSGWAVVQFQVVESKPFACSSKVQDLVLVQENRKGMTIDPTTLEMCMDRMLTLWPNVEPDEAKTGDARIRNYRLYRAWDSAFDTSSMHTAWDRLKTVLDNNDAAVFIDTQITCKQKKDEEMWEWTQELLQLLGPSRVLGISVGVEVDALYKDVDTTPDDCLNDIWGAHDVKEGRLYRSYMERWHWLNDTKLGRAKVTSVLSGEALDDMDMFRDLNASDPECIQPKNSVKSRSGKAPCHRVASLLQAIGTELTTMEGVAPAEKEESLTSWIFAISNQPYTNEDINRNCPKDEGFEQPLAFAKNAFGRPTASWDANHTKPTSGATGGSFRWMVGRFRNALQSLEPFKSYSNAKKYPLWVLETGWSSALDPSLKTAMRGCDRWSSPEVQAAYYQAFLAWDLSNATPWSGVSAKKIPGLDPRPSQEDCEPPEYVFYSTMRDFHDPLGMDSSHFGLVGSCDPVVECKLQALPSLLAPHSTLPPQANAAAGRPGALRAGSPHYTV